MRTKNNDLVDRIFIVIGADIIFNNGACTNQLIHFFHDILLEHFKRKNVNDHRSLEEQLIDMAFGC